MTSIEIPKRFNGPPGSANGGYIGGLIADRIGAASAEITLRAPPPLGVALDLRSAGDGLFELHDGDTLLAEARVTEFDVEVPKWPNFDEAAAAGALGRMRAHANTDNPYRRCFGCGIDRADGLRIVPTPVGESGLVASDWTPHGSLADVHGVIPAPVVWAALDCPAGIAWSYRLPDAPPMMTGRIAARIDRPVHAGESYVVIGWPISQDGRKLLAGTALVDTEGTVRARTLQLWLLPRS